MDKWISVEQRLPEDGISCWAYNGNRVVIAYNLYGYWIDADFGDGIDVTHWQELTPPDPPEEKE